MSTIVTGSTNAFDDLHLLPAATLIEDSGLTWIGHWGMAKICVVQSADTLRAVFEAHVSIPQRNSTFPIQTISRCDNVCRQADLQRVSIYTLTGT